jgi:hypothetical protein
MGLIFKPKNYKKNHNDHTISSSISSINFLYVTVELFELQVIFGRFSQAISFLLSPNKILER